MKFWCRLNTAVRIIMLSCLVVASYSCAKGPQEEIEVYRNDFEVADLAGISGPLITSYNGSKVLGRYNNDGFTLELNGLPDHDVILVAFDLYIHDTWDGNDLREGGPDVWQMRADGDLYINTTFSNCASGFCIPQSYPLNFPNNKNSPRTAAYRTDLPGACHLGGLPGATSQYKVLKKIRHSGKKLILECLDKLVQRDNTDPVCNESWSVDNIVIKVVNLN